MNNYTQRVLDQFFQEFYSFRIKMVKHLDSNTKGIIDIPILLFWFSVIDFYGGIYYVGKHDKIQLKKTKKGEKFVLANRITFNEFIKDFFPYPENECGEFIYDVFRSGIVHQFSPKSSGLIIDASDNRLFVIRKNDVCKSSNDREPGTLCINIIRFESLVYEAYLKLQNDIEKNGMEQECERICRHLINNDIFEDEIEVSTQINKLSQKGTVQNFV
jgi:hypothetical protein